MSKAPRKRDSQLFSKTRKQEDTRAVSFPLKGPELDADSISPATKDPWGNVRMAASASTVISRKDFGLTWNTALETGGVLVGDEITITLDVQFVKSQA